MSLIKTYIKQVQETLDTLPVQDIDRVIEALYTARVGGRQVFIMGNGGSASTASHFVCDLSKNTRRADLPHFRVIGLTDNLALFSALANDEGYGNVFAEQLTTFLEPGDVVIGISTSGNSLNVLNGIETARKMGAVTIAFTGFDSGQLGPLVDINVHVKSTIIEQVEDVHLMLEHLICTVLRQRVESTSIQA
jgi:D-sedoheptulose 7-phosphate isomerase